MPLCKNAAKLGDFDKDASAKAHSKNVIIPNVDSIIEEPSEGYSASQSEKG